MEPKEAWKRLVMVFFDNATVLTWLYQFLFNHVLTCILLMNVPFEVPIPDSLSFDSIDANSLFLSLSNIV